MSKLYRVIREDIWIDAKKSQFIPRCGNDNSVDRVHLNLLETVGHIASEFFEPEERPIVLEIDVSSFSENIEWLEPSPQKSWKQPLANIQNLPVSSVVKVHKLEHSLVNGKNIYTLEKQD